MVRAVARAHGDFAYDPLVVIQRIGPLVVRKSSACAAHAGPATPIRFPSGSAKCPTTSLPFGLATGPITRDPPRLSAFSSAAATFETPT
jgi:hypothetical protein